MANQALLLILAAATVGVLHTIVPDHWAPIALLARQRGWSRTQTAGSAAAAGIGHALSTLLIAILVWAAGALLAARFANLVSLVSSLALLGFGAWIAIGSLREMRHQWGHTHLHRHADGTKHSHRHLHSEDERHAVDGNLAAAPMHEHAHDTSSRTALLLIIGSSPMVEGIPLFLAASRYGAALLATMAVVFALSTVATYVTLCVVAARGLQRLNFGRFEEYGEVISGSFVALIGAVFLIWPKL